MFETTFIPWLVAQESLNTLIGTRLYPGHAPDNVARPYIVWTVVTGTSEHTHSGPAFRSYRVQFSIFAETYNAAATIRDVLLSLLDGKRPVVSGLDELTTFLASTVHFYESDTKLHMISVDFDISFSA